MNECKTVGPGEERTKMVGGCVCVCVCVCTTSCRRLAKQLLNYQVGLRSTWLQWTVST